MIEPWIAWVCMLFGVCTWNPNWFIASGVFACATYLGKLAGEDN